MTTETQQLGTISGKVALVAKKDGEATGLKLEGRDDEWLNFSKPEYRSFFEVPEKGDNVKLGTTRGKDGRIWVKTCEIQKRGNGPQSTYDDGMVPAGGRDLSITRSVAVKAAADMVVACINRGEYDNIAENRTGMLAAIDVCAIAQDLERWMLRAEVPFE